MGQEMHEGMLGVPGQGQSTVSHRAPDLGIACDLHLRILRNSPLVTAKPNHSPPSSQSFANSRFSGTVLLSALDVRTEHSNLR